MLIKFNSEQERALHPQGRLINSFLMETYFYKELTPTQIEILSGKLTLVDFAKILSDTKRAQKLRLLICYLCSVHAERGMTELPEELLRYLSVDVIAKAAALTGHFAIIQQLNLPRDALNTLFTDDDIGVSLLAHDRAELFIQYLEFELSSTEKIKDLFILTDLYRFYQVACAKGHFEVMRYLEAVDGFDKLTAASDNEFGAYYYACSNGRLDIIEHLEAIDGFDRLAAASRAERYLSPYAAACGEGHMDVVKHLEAIDGFDRLLEASSDNYEAYREACANGRLDIVEHLEAIKDFDRLAANTTGYSHPYTAACRNGHIKVIEHLEAIDGFDRLAEACFNKYEAYQDACANGRLDIIEHLEAIDGFDKLAAARSSGYRAYGHAWENGHRDIIEHLEAIDGFEKLAAANSYHSYCGNLYKYACEHGRLDIIEHLEAIDGFDKLTSDKYDVYELYQKACQYGYIDIVRHLETKDGFDKLTAVIGTGKEFEPYLLAWQYDHPDVVKHLEAIDGFDKLAAISSNGFYVYRYTCGNGNLKNLKRLEEIIEDFERTSGYKDLKLRAVKVWDWAAYRYACASGCIDVMEHLERIDGFDKLAAVSANKYETYAVACQNGQYAAVKHLEEIDGFDKLVATSTDDFYPFRQAYKNSHMAIVKHLLNFSNVFSYAALHDEEYGKSFIYSFVESKLTALKKSKEAFEAEAPNGVYDINEDEAQYYFCILRNLIRRGVDRDYGDETREAEDLLDDIRFLLDIPAVCRLAHQVVNISEDSPGCENELLRLAMWVGNQEVIAILMQLPEVRRLAEANDYYRNEAGVDIDLRQIARDRESSMVALSVSEQRMVEKAKSYYQPTIDKLGGNELVFEALKAELKRRYEEAPALITCKDINGDEFSLELPFEWEDWQELASVLSPGDRGQALKAYYRHDAHTAYRYLSKPNYWMAADAFYVNIYYDEQGQQTNLRYSSYEKYIPLISLLYTVAFDDDETAIDGYTIKSRQDLFIKQLAYIGRAHNWDDSRPVIRDGDLQYDSVGNVVTEEYDDNKGDKPSCFSGVKRRLFQAILGHRLFKIITKDIVVQALNEQIRAYFDKAITVENCVYVKEAYESMIELEGDLEEHQKTLKKLDIPLDKMINDYLQPSSFAGCDFVSFDRAVGLEKLLNSKLIERANALVIPTLMRSSAFFSKAETEMKDEGEVACVKHPSARRS